MILLQAKVHAFVKRIWKPLGFLLVTAVLVHFFISTQNGGLNVVNTVFDDSMGNLTQRHWTDQCQDSLSLPDLNFDTSSSNFTKLVILEKLENGSSKKLSDFIDEENPLKTLVSLVQNFAIPGLLVQGGDTRTGRVTHSNSKVYDFRQTQPAKGYYKSVFSIGDEISDVLITTLVKDVNALGKDRSLEDYVTNTLEHFTFDKTKISLAFYFRKESDYLAAQKIFHEYYRRNNYQLSYADLGISDCLNFYNTVNMMNNFKQQVPDGPAYNRITLIYAPFLEESADEISREDRHKDSVQRARRKTIAKVRNFLYNRSHMDEKYTLTIDSDMMVIPPDMLEKFVKMGKELIVPRILRVGSDREYDKNTWIGERTKPEDTSKQNNYESYVPRPVNGKTKFLQDCVDEKITLNSPEAYTDNVVELDSVGGAILFWDNKIFDQGIQFPVFYLIGSDWDHSEGYDGVETEGLCYQAKTLGYKCYGVPNVICRHE